MAKIRLAHEMNKIHNANIFDEKDPIYGDEIALDTRGIET